MILAAGLGTRLRPLTNTTPKALVPVAGKPLLEHVVLKLKEAGYGRIVVNIHHLGQQIEDYLRAQDYFGMDIRISDERQMLLETGGAIRKARPLINTGEPLLVHNVDILSDADLLAPMEMAETKHTSVLIVSSRSTSRYLLFDKDLKLTGWTNEKTGETRSPHSDLQKRACHKWAFSGIHVLHPDMFPLMDQWPERFSIIDFYLQHCATHPITALPAELHMMDVGKIDTLAEADRFVRELRSDGMKK